METRVQFRERVRGELRKFAAADPVGFCQMACQERGVPSDRLIRMIYKSLDGLLLVELEREEFGR